MKFKVLFLSIFLAIFSLSVLGISKTALAQSTQEEISLFYSLIHINEDGTINVVEVIDYNFPSPRHGIYRQIPLTKENIEGKKYLMSASDVFVFDENNNDYPYQDNSTKRLIDLKIGDANKTLTGTKSYLIGYTVSGALTYFDTFDELYWNVTGNDWEVPITAAVTDIEFPDGVNLDDLKIYCYTGSYSSEDSNCAYDVVDEHTISIFTTYDELETHDLYAHEGLTIQVDFPKGNVAVLYPQEDFSSLWQTILFIAIGVVLLVTHLIWPLTLLVKNIKESRPSKEEKRVVAAWFDPPKTKVGRKLTAGEVGLLHDVRPDIRDITAELIQLAQKGYIKIVEEEKKFLQKKDFSLAIVKDWENSSELLDFEKKLLDSIFETKGVGTVVKLSELGKRIGFNSDINDVYKRISTQLVNDGILSENIFKTREKWMLKTVLAGVFFNPLMVIACIVGLKTIKKTVYGQSSIAESHSLKNFLESQDKQLEFQAKNQMFFEKLLPYAIAFGVEKVWMERFKDIEFTQPEWAEVYNFNSMAYSGFVNSFNTSATTAFAATSSTSSSGFSGGGGGFSGGGGGGGGGGSW